MKNKAVVGATMVLVSFITIMVLLEIAYGTLQATFNPIAAATATVVAVLGMIWFKKSNK